MSDDADIDFTESLLNFRQSLTDIEQWSFQGNREKTKSNMLSLSNTIRSAAEYFFNDVDCFEDYFKDYNIPCSEDSRHIVPEAYLMVCSVCGSKWVTRPDDGEPDSVICGSCDEEGSVHEELYPGIHTVPKVEVRKRPDLCLSCKDGDDE